MGASRVWTILKLAILTSVVIVSFIFSSLGWRHVDLDKRGQILVAAAILSAMYVLMIFELVNRNLAALIGAAASVAAYDCLFDYASMEEILQWEDLETLSLLLGMMIIVNVLSRSGLFNFLAIWSYRKSAGRFWLLITTMACITALLSAFIDNVSTMLLMAPTLIRLSELEHVDPRYVLMIMVMYSNIGGCATPIGDPPNLIIIGDSMVQSLDITFGSYVAYCGPCVLLIMTVTMLYLKIVYKSKESFRLKQPVVVRKDHGRELDLVPVVKCPAMSWDNSPSYKSKLNEGLDFLASVRSELERSSDKLMMIEIDSILKELDKQIDNIGEQVRAASRSCSLRTGANHEPRGSRLSLAAINQLMEVYSIKSWPTLIQSLSVLLVAVLLFFIQSLPGSNMTLGWISLFAGLTLLIMSSGSSARDAENPDQNKQDEDEEDNFESVIRDIEWSTLIFFFGLFIVMEVMEKLGLISFMGEQITLLVELIPQGQMRSMGAITIILWCSGIASACIDNVPFTSMMIKVLAAMMDTTAPNQEAQMAAIKPLVFALALGACLGGNGTLIGASANLITASISGRHNYPISFGQFFRFACPITIISLLLANLYLVLVFVVFGF